MKYLLLLFSLVLLQSCGEAPQNNALTQNFGASGTLLVKVHHFGQAVANVTVSLDGAGDVYTQTDNAGTATFQNVKSGKHDIHILPSESTATWVSMYGVSGSQVFVDLNRFAASTVSVSGSVSNATANGSAINMLFVDSPQASFVGKSTPTSNTHSGTVNVENMMAGTTMTGDMFFLEEEHIGDTMTVVDGQTMLGLSLATASSLTKNIAFSINKPTASTLLTVNGFAAPTGMSVSSLALQYAPPVYGQTVDLYHQSNLAMPSVGSPLVIKAYDSADLASSSAYLRLQDTVANPSWRLVAKASKGEATHVAAQFTRVPSVNAGQIGKVLLNNATALTNITGGYTANRLHISAVGGSQVLWEVIFPPKTTQIQLPTLPTHVTSVLVAGNKYDLELQAEILGTYTYQQMVAEDFATLNERPTPWEWLKSSKVSYMR
ncbi:MAG: hypothetical protein R8M45_10780 [Ghiorsea sp.]